LQQWAAGVSIDPVERIFIIARAAKVIITFSHTKDLAARHICSRLTDPVCDKKMGAIRIVFLLDSGAFHNEQLPSFNLPL
jgi:hypothetical protein